MISFLHTFWVGLRFILMVGGLLLLTLVIVAGIITVLFLLLNFLAQLIDPIIFAIFSAVFVFIALVYRLGEILKK